VTWVPGAVLRGGSCRDRAGPAAPRVACAGARQPVRPAVPAGQGGGAAGAAPGVLRQEDRGHDRAAGDGRAYYDRKLAEGKTHKEALRCLKRRISDAIFARLQADARRVAAAASARGPGGQPGNGSVASAAGSHPGNRLFGQATPEPATTLRPSDGPAPIRPAAAPKKPGKAFSAGQRHRASSRRSGRLARNLDWLTAGA
jgi:hypothetical protein